MNQTFSATNNMRANVFVSFVTLDCTTCGILFAMPTDFQRLRVNDHGNFYCPNGHRNWYGGKSEAEQLREKLAAEIKYREELDKWHTNRNKAAKEEAQSYKYKAMAERSHKVRLQKRIAAGVCPCCTRSFTNLSKHMAHMHPNYSPKANE